MGEMAMKSNDESCSHLNISAERLIKSGDVGDDGI